MSEQERERIEKASDEGEVEGHPLRRANEEGPGQETDDPQLVTSADDDDVEGHPLRR